jgi:hypothetical protein
VPPEAYFVFIDAYLAAHADALVLVATDDLAYLARMRRRYGGGEGGGALRSRLVRRHESVVYRKASYP